MTEQKKKKKFPWGMVLYFIGCLAVGALIGVILGSSGAELNPMDMVFVMVIFVAMFYLHVIVHEAGHMLMGLLTGYGFLSYRVGSFMWEKGADGKVRFSRFSLAGTGGQCLMSPPDYNNGDFPYVWYNLGGALVNIVLGLLGGVAVLIFPMGTWMKIACVMLLLTGVILGLMNGLPIPGNKLNNDGSNILAISRSPEARRAFWLQMKINEQVAWGKRLCELPEEYFQPFPPESRANAMVAAMDVLAASRKLDALELEEAERIMLPLMDDKHVPALYHQTMTFDLATIEMLCGRPAAMVEKLKSKEIVQFAKAMKTYPSVLRTQYIAALLLDKDEKKAEEIRARFEKMVVQYPHASEVISERELMDMAAAKAQEV